MASLKPTHGLFGEDPWGPIRGGPPGILDTLGAALKSENTLGALFRNPAWVDPRLRTEPVDAKAAYDELRGQHYGHFLDRLPTFENRYDVERWKAGIDAELRERAVLEEAGVLGTVAATALGFADPINLIPVGGAAYRIVGTAGRLRGAVAGGLAGIAGASASELVLQSQQITRTGEESAVTIGASAVLGGLLGGALAGLSPKRINDLANGMHAEDAAIREGRAPSTVGAAAMTEAGETGLEATGAVYQGGPVQQWLVRNINRIGGPLGRLQNSMEPYANWAVARMATQVVAKVGRAVESVQGRTAAWDGPLQSAIQAVDEEYKGFMKAHGYSRAADLFKGRQHGFNVAVNIASREAAGFPVEKIGVPIHTDTPGQMFTVTPEMVPFINRAAKRSRVVWDMINARAREQGLVTGGPAFGEEQWGPWSISHEKLADPTISGEMATMVETRFRELRDKADAIREETSQRIVDAQKRVANTEAGVRKVIDRFPAAPGRLEAPLEDRRAAAFSSILGTRPFAEVREDITQTFVTEGLEAALEALPVPLREAATQALPTERWDRRLRRLLAVFDHEDVRDGLTIEQHRRLDEIRRVPTQGRVFIGAEGELVEGRFGRMGERAADLREDAQPFREFVRELEATRETLPPSSRHAFERLMADPEPDAFVRAAELEEDLAEAIKRGKAELGEVREDLRDATRDARQSAKDASESLKAATRRAERDLPEPDLRDLQIGEQRYLEAVEHEFALHSEQADAVARWERSQGPEYWALLDDITAREKRIVTAEAASQRHLGTLQRRIGKLEAALTKRLEAERQAGAVAGERAVHAERLQAAIAAHLEARERAKTSRTRLGEIRELLDLTRDYASKQRDLVKGELRAMRAAEQRRALTDQVAGRDDAELRADALAYVDRARATHSYRDPFMDASMGKARSLHERSGLFTFAEMTPYLELDMMRQLHATRFRLIPDIEMHAVFGDTSGETVAATLADRWRGRIDAARQAGATPRALRRLEAAAASDVEDIRGIAARLRNVYDIPDDPSELASVVPRILKKLSVPVNLGMVTLSNLPDIGKLLFRNGFRNTFQPLIQGLRNPELFKLALRDSRLAGAATEFTFNTYVHNIAQLMQTFGRGSRLERGVDKLTAGFSIMSGIAPFTQMLKMWAAVSMQSRFLPLVRRAGADWSTLTKREANWLLQNGIDAQIARDMAGEIAAHSRVEGGLGWANTESWRRPELARTFHMALRREVDLTITTPGQELPLLMSKQYAGLFFQFQSFQQATMMRTVAAGIQQADMSIVLGATTMLGMSALALWLKDFVVGKEWFKNLDDEQIFMRIVDGSGLVPWLFSANMALERATGGTLGLTPALTDDESRFRGYNASVLGAVSPSLGMVENWVKAVGAFAGGDPAAAKYARRAVPLNGIPQFRWAFDRLERAAAEAIRQ